MRVKAITPLGTFYTPDNNLSEEVKKDLKEFLEKVNDLNFFTAETEEGLIYLPKGVIQNSVFLIVD